MGIYELKEGAAIDPVYIYSLWSVWSFYGQINYMYFFIAIQIAQVVWPVQF